MLEQQTHMLTLPNTINWVNIIITLHFSNLHLTFEIFFCSALHFQVVNTDTISTGYNYIIIYIILLFTCYKKINNRKKLLKYSLTFIYS